MSHPKIVVLTNIPTYHQVDLFDELADSNAYDIEVFYLRSMTPGRHWTKLPEPAHPHRMLPVAFEKSVYYLNPTLVTDFIRARPDVLIVGQYAGWSYQVAMYLATLAKIPWVFWCEPMGVKHFEVTQLTPELFRNKMRKAAYWPAQKFAAQHWGIGVKAQHQFEEMTGLPAHNFPYYSKLSRFSRGELPYMPNGKVRFLFAGRYSYRKGFDVLLDAFSQLDERGVDPATWSLTLCGKGEMGERIANYPDIITNITDLGFQELERMPGIMKSHDVFIAPSRYDGWGMVVPEALAAGMPVITTHAMGSAEDIGKSFDWLHLNDPGNSEQLTESLQQFLSKDTHLKDLGVKACEAAQQYDVAAARPRFEALISDLLSPGVPQ
ncbi:glycosyltransferase family 4 protein [Bradymonas sediminis]|uniref:Uncharacterized protein n=1 Tax=Bradymonas sediminis TaxID=1548548 RepID=A0A2Z4FR30_9DELT|nr:glycosyltransferase family 4 protein [Bradymonas sediminis]AWV91144.1 hypothetical protein DN745_18150 [Bradymonas sediminis]TDP73703.1 glycosyltransferase involved in cell wall biosynthesis [Bradymonas sediminis]